MKAVIRNFVISLFVAIGVFTSVFAFLGTGLVIAASATDTQDDLQNIAQVAVAGVIGGRTDRELLLAAEEHIKKLEQKRLNDLKVKDEKIANLEKQLGVAKVEYQAERDLPTTERFKRWLHLKERVQGLKEKIKNL